MVAYDFLADHLDLSLEKIPNDAGKVDESFVVIESYEDMLVFGSQGSYPKDAVKPKTALP